MTDKELFEYAQAAMQRAYAPYSGFFVGAAVLTTTGEVFGGANIENASYGASLCAERVALAAAVFAGYRSEIARIAICASDGRPAMPCGICRQVLVELGPRIQVITGTDSLHLTTHTAEALLPEAFKLIR